ncbi:MAG TPA: DUF2059 domain-containing protein [Candidatus Sulfotelmatobacter sp.]|nr:DUF2059 domain-containing protein [Candidatus Sulfotelmatobacter sp.]
MKHLLLGVACLLLAAPVVAQSGDQTPSRDDIIVYLRTMHSHDMLQKTMQVQAESMRQLYRDMILKDKGKLPDNFDSVFKGAMDDLIKGMPSDEIVQAMIPAYQKHFTKSDIEAMNAFYSSPVGQKVLEQLPSVLQEGNQAAMPILSRYLGEWGERMKHQLDQMKLDASPTKGKKAVIEN